MRPAHQPPRDKRYFHTHKKYGNVSRVQLKAKRTQFEKSQQRHALRTQLKACRRPR